VLGVFKGVGDAALNNKKFSNGCFFIGAVAKVFGNSFLKVRTMFFNSLTKLLKIGFSLAPRRIGVGVKG